MTRQLVLDLAHRPAFGRQDLLVAPSNAAAVAHLDSWPDWPAPGLVIHGPPACGKSHLAAVFRARAGARAVDPAALTVDSVPALAGGAVVIDGAGPEIDGRALLHLYNLLAERGGHLLLTAEVPPARWAIHPPDLASRLAALPTVAVGAPDESLLAALLVKHFADRQLAVTPEVVSYLVTRLPRSFAAVAAAAAAMDRRGLAARRPPTVSLARDVLREIEQEIHHGD
ncbi:MAG: regulatory inactivation of DnaA Hda protein [Thalassobaculales bacterium]